MAGDRTRQFTQRIVPVPVNEGVGIRVDGVYDSVKAYRQGRAKHTHLEAGKGLIRSGVVPVISPRGDIDSTSRSLKVTWMGNRIMGIVLSKIEVELSSKSMESASQSTVVYTSNGYIAPDRNESGRIMWASIKTVNGEMIRARLVIVKGLESIYEIVGEKASDAINYMFGGERGWGALFVPAAPTMQQLGDGRVVKLTEDPMLERLYR